MDISYVNQEKIGSVIFFLLIKRALFIPRSAEKGVIRHVYQYYAIYSKLPTPPRPPPTPAHTHTHTHTHIHTHTHTSPTSPNQSWRIVNPSSRQRQAFENIRCHSSVTLYVPPIAHVKRPYPFYYHHNN